MRYGVSAGPIPLDLPYAEIIQAKCDALNFSSPLAYAVAWRESIRGQCGGMWDACTIESSDGGHGLFQLTSSFPSDWNDAGANAAYAIEHFLLPAFDEFGGRGMVGEALVRLVAAAFNAGPVTAWQAHVAGNVDDVTTDDYAADVLRQYLRLANKQHPN